jgi:hypothetical protein
MLDTLLLAGLLSAAPFENWTSANTIEVIGWNAEGTRLGLRVFDGRNEDDLDPGRYCPGYVDKDGHPFTSGLSFVVLEVGKPAQRFPIQEAGVAPQCTPVATAKAQLATAKRALTAAGIDAARAGRTAEFFALADRSVLNDDAFDLSVIETSAADAANSDDFASRSGSFALQVGEKTLDEVPYSLTSSRMAGGDVRTEAGPVFISPSGSVAFVFAQAGTVSFRGGQTDYVLLGSAQAPAHPALQPAPDPRTWLAGARIEPVALSERGDLAVRVFEAPSRPDAPLCPGYIDAQNHPFRGGLSLVVVSSSSVIGLRIQDDASLEGARCTPPATAAARLSRAKALLKSRGLDPRSRLERVPLQAVVADGGVGTRWQALDGKVTHLFSVSQTEARQGDALVTRETLRAARGNAVDFVEPQRTTASAPWQLTLDGLFFVRNGRAVFVHAVAVRGDSTRQVVLLFTR